MANVKNFGLIGVADNVQFGKAGPKLKQTTGTFEFRNAADNAAAALTAAGITSASGNVTLTTGNVVLSNSGVLTLGDAGSLSRVAAGIYQFGGTGAMIVPSGTAAQQPTAATYEGGFRYNQDSNTMEYSNGTAWTTIATGGTAMTAVTVASANGLAGTSSGGTTPELTLSTTVTGLLKGNGTAISAVVSGTDLKTVNGTTLLGSGDVGTIGPTYGGTGLSSFSSGSVLYASGANTWSAAAPGATSGVQAYDADLDALAGLSGTGIIVRTGAGTATTRTITGVSGRISVSDGNGVSGEPTIDLATVTNPGTGGTFVKITTDAYGRVTDSTAVVTSDITSLVDSTYVNVGGDTMTGNLVMGTNYVTMNNAPTADTQAANKAYVDSVAAGLTWKTAVLAASTGNLTLSGEQTVDGVALVTGNRVLVKDQSTAADNGIYIVSSGSWTRSTDADTPAELDSATVFVQQGTANADTGWTQTTTIVTVGTTSQTWVQFSGSNAYTWGTGLGNTGNTVFVKLGAGIAELPSDEIGIDVASGKAVQLTGSLAGDQLTFVLDGGAASGLEQSASGLKISAGGVTNAMLANSSLSLTADSGSSSISLGGTLHIQGNATQGTSVGVSGTTYTVTVQNATTAVKGVASFDSANFDVTSGAVSLKAGGVDLTTDVTGTLPVANGGTGVSSLNASQVLFGGSGGTTVAQDAEFTYNASTDTLTVGTGTIQGASGGDLTITATATNADINLVPNGTGAVVIGPSGAGTISSDSGQTLTINGVAGLNLQAGTSGNVAISSTAGTVNVTSASGDITMTLAAGTADKVTIAGPSAADYISGLSNNDLVTKYYVDQTAGFASGDVKAVKATFSLAATGTFNIGSALPAGATILSVKANVTSADTGTGTLSVGKAGSVSAYMTTSENDTQTAGMYLAETMVTEGSSEQVIGTVAGTPAGAGSVTVVVTYQIA